MIKTTPITIVDKPVFVLRYTNNIPVECVSCTSKGNAIPIFKFLKRKFPFDFIEIV